MDHSTGTGMYGDRLPYESNGSGWMQQEDSAISGSGYGGDFFADAQVLEYSPFDEEENPEQGEYPNEAGDSVKQGYSDGMETEEALPVGSDGTQAEFLLKEAQTDKGAGQPYIKEQDAEEADEESGQQDAEEPDADEISEEEALQEGKSAESSAEKEAEEERKRAEHEASEAKRKAEWEARQQAKKDAEKAHLARIAAMGSDELAAESMKRVMTDTEKLTRRNMKECVAEYIQTMCLEDAVFATQVMLHRQNMVRCFQYINRKAYEYVQDEMKAAGVQPGRETLCYSSDIPDDVCYHWAEEYFRTMDVKEDKEEEEEFVPKPYIGTSASGSRKKKSSAKKSAAKKPAGKKTAEKKVAEKKPDNGNTADGGQLSFAGQISFEDIMGKAG